ncbi:transcriptional regulator [Microbacterium sp. LB16]|uniref:transcriptional regulator n=1 Tax=unclassified Microbacterium TaxID=2609290 RepID=UPI003FA55C94
MTSSEPHLADSLNEIIHHPRRLALLAYLTECDDVEFGVLRDMLQISDSSLSKHLSTLREAGYVSVAKAPVPGAVHTWVTCTN